MGLVSFLRGDMRAASDVAPAPLPPTALPRLDRSFGTGLPGTTSLPTLSAVPTASGLMVGQATSMQVSTVYACVRIRSRDLARCAPVVQRVDAAGSRAAVPDHPLTALFRRPNRVQTWFEFCEQQHTALMLRSNAYAVILRDRRGVPIELIPVNPDLVTLLEAPDGSLFYQVSTAGLWLAAALAGVGVVVPACDVLHVRDLSFNGLSGVARIALARDAIGLAMVQEQQASRWAGNGARPAGVLQSAKPISEPVARRLKAQWDAVQSGIRNTGGTAVLEDGIEWKPMALTSVDLEFVEARLVQVKEIARFFEVPLHKLGENEGLPRASVAELNADYVQNVVMSDATRWEQRIAATFDLAADEEVKFDERGLLRADLGTMINAARAGVLSGLMTQNEGRLYIGYGPMAGGDALLAPVNLAPNGSAADGTAPDDAGRPRAGELPGAAKHAAGRAAGGTARTAADPLSGAAVERIAAAVAAQLRSNPNHDARGRFSSGEGGGDDDAADHPRVEQPRAEHPRAEHAGPDVSHEIRLLVKGLAVTAAAGIVAALAPEGTVTAAVVAAADHFAGGYFIEAGAAAAKAIAADLGLDTGAVAALAAKVEAILKSAPAATEPLAAVRARLPAVLHHARDVLVAAVTGGAAESAGGEASDGAAARLAAVVAAIDARRDAVLARLAATGKEVRP